MAVFSIGLGVVPFFGAQEIVEKAAYKMGIEGWNPLRPIERVRLDATHRSSCHTWAYEVVLISN